MIHLDLTKGITETAQYKAWEFPGGEIHFILKWLDTVKEPVKIITRLNLSKDIIFLGIVVDTLKKDGCPYIEVFIPYMPYAQADRNFGEGESFTLKTMINRWFNQLPVDKYIVFDPHSDVTPALLKNVEVLSNDDYISYVLNEVCDDQDDLCLLSPDAGAFKKIYKLAERVGFKGEILCCQKDRDIKTGVVKVIVPPLPDKDVLIIDDICVGGRTFVEIGKQDHRPKRKLKLYLAVSHGIFCHGTSTLEEYFTKVFTTNSRKDDYQNKFIHNYKLF